MRPWNGTAATGAMLAALLMLSGGCGDGGKAAGGPGGGAAASGWAIAADAFEGPNHQALAEQRRMEFVSQTKLGDWWVKHEANTSLVLYGRYDDPKDGAARADLQKLHQLTARGQITPRTLMLTPIARPVAAGVGGLAQYDLRRAARRGVYTLQMAVYDERFGSDFRRAAEKAAAALREEGTEAYFYHGPNRSMVTVGVFGEDAARYNAGGLIVYSDAVKRLRNQYPYNLVNGRTMRVRQGEGDFYEAPSHLVRIPGAR